MKNLWQALMLVRQCDRWTFWRRVMYVVLCSLLPLVNLYVLKVLIDSVTNGVNSGTWIGWLLIMTSVFLLNRVVAVLDRVNGDVLSQRLIDYLSDLMQCQATRLDMSYYDTPSYHDTYHRAQQEASTRPISILNNFMSLVGALISMIGVVVMWLMAGGGWLMLLVMIVAVLPSFFVRLCKAKSIYAFRRGNTQLYRRSNYYNALLTARDPAKEVRAFGMKYLFRERFVEARKTLVAKLLKISRRLGMLDILCAVIEAAAMLAVIYVLAVGAIDKVYTIGTFVMLFEAFRRGQSYLQNFVAGVTGLYDSRLFVSNLFEFLCLEPKILSPNDPEPMPEEIESIELRDVTFRYLDMQCNVLQHYNLVAKKGEITRIEGENGAGKSTIVKLLLRLYDPQEGTVMINGIDIRRFSLEELRSKMATVFQEFTRFNVSLEENISFGGKNEKMLRLLKPLIEFENKLPHGRKTILGRLFDGGAELSMGQWQRVAIARMLASDAPVMLMDEPTAWLDMCTRQTLNEIIEQLKEGKVIIIIEHK